VEGPRIYGTRHLPGEIWDKKAFLKDIKAPKLASDVQEKDLKIPSSDDTVMFTHMEFLKTPDGALVEMIATRVFVKQRGSWKLASVQEYSISDPPGDPTRVPTKCVLSADMRKCRLYSKNDPKPKN
jgi:hypothetical protein